MLEQTSQQTNQPTTSLANSDDLLWRHLKTVPAFRALLRSVEARFYRAIDLPEPILDLGCGDGHFAQMTFTKPLMAGVDPWWGPLQKARRSEAYDLLVQSLGDRLPFPDNYFGTIISNSVLEHIPDVQAVLVEAGRVIQPGGRLLITMPSHFFTQELGGAEFFEKVGSEGLANQYRRFFNFIARHVHTDPPEIWAERLAKAGFSIDRWQYYFSRKALHALEWGHIQGLPSAVIHALTGHWIVGPWENNLARTERWVRPYYDEPFSSTGTYLFFSAQKRAGTPAETQLPVMRPFKVEELERTVNEPSTEINSPDTELVFREASSRLTADLTSAELDGGVTRQIESDSSLSKTKSIFRFEYRQIQTGLLIASLICAGIGQASLHTSQSNTAAGIRWYGYSFIILAIVALGRYRGQWPGVPRLSRPQLGPIPRQRWYFLLALFLAVLAPRIVTNPSSKPHPWLAIFLWAGSGAIAFYALRPQILPRFSTHVSRFTLIASIILFLSSFIIRLVALTGHPFILNGVEASIGLDLINVRDGLSQNPFATGWLSNPTLPYYLLVWPVRWWGPTALSIRLFSPLIGALTVVLTYLIGEKLWGRETGLLAAVLLLGSHFHLHYSRLGMTNIWDPLLTLLALGLLGIAWQQIGEDRRVIWLVAGTVVGLNAYLFSGSHLLPLMLVTLAITVVLFHRSQLGQYWRHLLAAAAMAFIIALPQLLYYNNNPGVFMERANVLGIRDQQTGWLSQEAARRGISQSEVMQEQLVQALLSFNSSLDKSGAYRPERPLLGYGTAVLFVLGLGLAIVRLRQFRYSLLLVWIIIPIIFAGALLLESPSSHRLIITAPALCILAAIALSEIGRWLQSGLKRRASTATLTTDNQKSPSANSSLRLPILLAVAILIALLDINFYFVTYRQQHSFADRNTEIADNLADYLNTLGADWDAYFFGAPSMYVDFPTITFLVENFQKNINLFDTEGFETALIQDSGKKKTFVFLPEHSAEIGEAQTRFPDGHLLTFHGFHADPLFFAYEVTP